MASCGCLGIFGKREKASARGTTFGSSTAPGNLSERYDRAPNAVTRALKKSIVDPSEVALNILTIHGYEDPVMLSLPHLEGVHTEEDRWRFGAAASESTVLIVRHEWKLTMAALEKLSAYITACKEKAAADEPGFAKVKGKQLHGALVGEMPHDIPTLKALERALEDADFASWNPTGYWVKGSVGAPSA